MLFTTGSPTPLKIGQPGLLKNSIFCLVQKLPSGSKIAKGQVNQITNVSFFPIKHRMGGGATFVTLCCDDTPEQETFTTLGLKPEGMTHTEVNSILITEFNKQPIGLASVTAAVAKKILSKTSPIIVQMTEYLKDITISSMAEFIEMKSGKITLQAELANITFKEARSLFSGWAAEL